MEKSQSQFKKLSVIIPVFNERETLQELLQKVADVEIPGIDKEIIVVDDGSTDGSRELLRKQNGVVAIYQDRNRGKGSAVKAGMASAKGDIFLVQDADLEYNPNDYAKMIDPILKGESELVMGSRFLTSRPHFFTRNRDPFMSHYIGNHIIIWLTNFLYGQRNTDYEGCYKAFTRSVANSVSIRANGFAFDNELICKWLRKGQKIVEVPIRYEPRIYSQGKKIKWWHGAAMVWTIIKWRFAPF